MRHEDGQLGSSRIVACSRSSCFVRFTKVPPLRSEALPILSSCCWRLAPEGMMIIRSWTCEPKLYLPREWEHIRTTRLLCICQEVYCFIILAFWPNFGRTPLVLLTAGRLRCYQRWIQQAVNRTVNTTFVEPFNAFRWAKCCIRCVLEPSVVIQECITLPFWSIFRTCIWVKGHWMPSVASSMSRQTHIKILNECDNSTPLGPSNLKMLDAFIWVLTVPSWKWNT